MPGLREALVYGVAGAGDELTDLLVEYVDTATGAAGKPAWQRPSTWIHLGAGVGLFILGTRVAGPLGVVASVLGGRHLGAAVRQIAESLTAPRTPAPAVLVLEQGSGKAEVEASEVALAPAEAKAEEVEAVVV